MFRRLIICPDRFAFDRAGLGHGRYCRDLGKRWSQTIRLPRYVCTGMHERQSVINNIDHDHGQGAIARIMPRPVHFWQDKIRNKPLLSCPLENRGISLSIGVIELFFANEA